MLILQMSSENYVIITVLLNLFHVEDAQNDLHLAVEPHLKICLFQGYYPKYNRMVKVVTWMLSRF